MKIEAVSMPMSTFDQTICGAVFLFVLSPGHRQIAVAIRERSPLDSVTASVVYNSVVTAPFADIPDSIGIYHLTSERGEFFALHSSSVVFDRWRLI